MTLSLPPRRGSRPQTGSTVPHLQLSDLSPPDVRAALLAWAQATFDDVRHGQSHISVRGADGFFVEPTPGTTPTLMPPAGDTEWIHLHPDGSVHACLSPTDEAEVLAADWGERHPFHDRGAREILVYAPRDEDELAVLKDVFTASHRYASTGA